MTNSINKIEGSWKLEVRRAVFFQLPTSNFHLLKYALLLLFFTNATISFSQDIHFSQFMQSPLNLNPAQTGNFKGAYRFAGNFRRQWSSITIPYQTFGISAEAKDLARIKNTNAGISVYQDKTGDSHFSTLQLNLALSQRFNLKKDKSEYFSIGIQSGFTQRRIDYSNLSYDNQYNGFYYDPSLPTNETFQNDGRIYLNLNSGINWVKHFEKRKNISAGIALFNINKPPQSFFGNSNITLDRRLAFNVAGQYKLSDKWDLIPSMLFMGQGTFRELIIGSSVKYILKDSRQEYRAIYAGGWARTRDAGFVSVGIDYNEWFVGLSYDINFSNLRPASNGRGGFELSVIYIVGEYLPKRLKYKVCPEFM